MVAALTLAGGYAARGAEVRVYPAPAGEPLSTSYTLAVEGKDAPVYIAKVGAPDKARRWRAMDDKLNSALFYDTASFAYFDIDGAVNVTVNCPDAVKEAKILPTSFGIKPAVEGKRITFKLDKPRNVVLEINGNWVNSLQIFANPMEKDAPSAQDPNVIYYGPGIHEVEGGVHVTSGKTVYIAGGAVVRGKLKDGRRGGAVFAIEGDNITLRGRGIIDGGLFPTHAKNMISVHGSNIRLEGVIVRDSPHWTIPIRVADHVKIDNIKLLGYRANSDGIDICNARDVEVKGCFLRTLDDLVVIKTYMKGQGEARDIRVSECVLWNEVAHALSIGAELRDNVSNVRFFNCDVIHDKGREWALRVYHCDAALIHDVVFEDIRIEETRKLISLWINKAVWSKDEERGRIENVTFRNIQATGDKPLVELKGYDKDHLVRNTRLEGVAVNGQPLKAADVKRNEFVEQVEVTGGKK